MECKKYWEILELSTLDRNKIEDVRIKLDEHIRACELCNKKFKKVKKFDNTVKFEMRNIDIPIDLESNIKYRLINVKKRSFINKISFPSGIAAVFLLIFFTFIKPNISDRNGLENIADNAFKSHNKLMGMEFTDSGSDKFVKKWFAKKLDFPVILPNLNKSFMMLGGRKCTLCNEDVAYLFYKLKDNNISLFVFDPDKYDLTDKNQYFSKNNETAFIWIENKTGYCLVSDLNEKNLHNLVYKNNLIKNE